LAKGERLAPVSCLILSQQGAYREERNRRIPLGETKWQLRFVNTGSDKLSRDVPVVSQVQTNRFLSDESAYLLASLLGSEVAAVERERRSTEGEQRAVQTLRAVRSPALRAEAKRKHGLRRFCCGFHFEEFYGQLGAGVGIVHHLDPLGGGGVRETTANDVRVVCANCHDILHMTDPPLGIEELRRHIGRRCQRWTEYGIHRK
jgi:predicted HNH restriction endonuclease